MGTEGSGDQPSFRYVGGELESFAHAKNWKAYFSRALRPYLGGRVLEVGAGIGTTMLALNRGEATCWTCLEPDRLLAERIPIAGRAGAVRVDVRVCTLEDIPLIETFDTVIYIDVLEHIEDDRGQLAKAREHLAPKGRVVVLSPAYPCLFSPFDEQVGHFRRYTRRTLRAVASEGLEVERLFYLDALGVAASLVNKLLLRRSTPSIRQVRFWDRVMIPLSCVVDPILFHTIGRSVIGIFRRSDD